MNKIVVMVVVLSLLAGWTGCIKKEEENKTGFYRTSALRIGDKITYEVWGKMTVKREEGGFLIYQSKGEMSIEVKKATVEDGFGNTVDVVDFYEYLSEIPYNYTIEKREDLPVTVEKHVYRLLQENKVGGMIKSVTTHHAINRDRIMGINSMPLNDIIDFFLEKDFNSTMQGNFYYEGLNFEWEAAYDENFHTLRIDVHPDVNANVSIWLKNGYPLPYQISFSTDDGTKANTYRYILKSFRRGDGEELHLSDVPYNSSRNMEFYSWKDYGAPLNGNPQNFSVSIQTAMVQAMNYPGLKSFLAKHPDAYMVYAEYWHGKDEEGWLLHFGDKNTKEDYVLNISSTGRAPIPSKEISPYLAYEEIPKDFDDISNKMLSIEGAEKIFGEELSIKNNFTFYITFVEDYYPDTLFDILEGNTKEKEISSISPSPRGACAIEGLKGMVRDYFFGYRLVVLSPPFITFDGKLNGENGMLTYVYSEHV